MTRRKMERRGNAPGQRPLRVGEEMRHALVGILDRHRLADPDLADRRVTVTAVDVSPDLKNATVFILPFAALQSPAEADLRLVKALNRAAGYFRGRLAEAMTLRVSPQLRFRLDESFAASGRIEALLHDPAIARDLAKPEEES